MKSIFLLVILISVTDLASGQHKVRFIVHDQSPIQREHVYITGDFNNWDSLSNSQNKLNQETKGIHSITLDLLPGRHEFKLTGGNWQSVEKEWAGYETKNRSFMLVRDTSIMIDVFQWRDLMITGNRLLLQKTSEDTIRLKSYTVLGFAYSTDPAFYNIDSSLHYFQMGMQLIEKLNTTGIERSWSDFNDWKTILQFNYAVQLRSMGNYLKALEIRIAILRNQESLKDTLAMIDALNQITSEYLQVKDIESALSYNRMAMQLLNDVHTTDIQFLGHLKQQTHFQLATCYYHQNELDKGLTHANLASLETIKNYDYHTQAYISQLIGDIYLKRRMQDSANWFYRESIWQSRSTQNLQALSLSFKGIALAFREKGQIDSALFYARHSLGVIRNNTTMFKSAGQYAESYIADLSPIIADLFRRKNQMDSAYHYLQLSVTLKDSINNSQKARDFQNFSFNESIRKQQQEQQIRDERQRASTRLKMYAFVAGILVLSSLALFQYRNNKQKQATNLLLNRQKSDLENTLGTLQLTQKQLIQSEKMASLGELTAGIAHEIQNPLNFVNNFSEVSNELLDEMKDELAIGNKQQAIEIANDVKQNLEKVMHHGKRADAIVKGMLQHSRTSSSVKEPTDINALCDEYFRLAYHGLRAKDKTFNATMKTDFDPSIGMINVIPQDIGRVILNLITNAFYAVSAKAADLNKSLTANSATADGASSITPYPLMLRPPDAQPGATTQQPGGAEYIPTVSISTKNISLPHPHSNSLRIGGRGYDGVEIRVRDNGPGIPDTIKDKIFQPFFTTKPTGQGTGLGLSLSYDIIKAHGGELKVETKEGEGSEFIIIFHQS